MFFGMAAAGSWIIFSIAHVRSSHYPGLAAASIRLILQEIATNILMLLYPT
jgi:hypothetical protein